MKSVLRSSLAAATILMFVFACSTPTDTQQGTTSLLTGFQSVQLAFSNVSSTFAGSAGSDSVPWCPPGGGHGERGGPRSARKGGSTAGDRVVAMAE